MFKFHLLRSGRDLIGHLILIFLPILLIALFAYINKTQFGYLGADLSHITTVLTIGFALTFQIYGSAISFETLGQDFLTPMHDRLLAAPVNPRKIVLSVMFTGIIVSFLQTLLIILFSIIVLDAKFNNLVLILIVMLISVIFNQLLGSVILFLTKKVNTATAITSLYGVVAPILTGLYFPLPDNRILNLFKDYLTPMSLANTAIYGIINEDIKNIIIGVTSLLVLIVILYISIKPLSKKVIL
ncbi:ABC transporter permease [Sedimentibacter sp.]|uniref:ABC transporter permease n=1 Tax=Sedimentibacter sp. TaxID=1960295 RepID=UPI0028B0F754|nr:ABC transporter permease [Sedimentibacter sp.]